MIGPEDTFDLCIYHRNCDDGLGAAWVARRRWPTIELYAANFNESPPHVHGRRVLIVDFSYPCDDLLPMWYEAEQLVVIDHHETAEEELKGLNFCIFDMERSGAGLTWDVLFPGEERPKLIDYIEDRDLWRRQLPDSKAFTAALRSLPRTLQTFSEVHYALELGLIEQFLYEGYAILRRQDQLIERMKRSPARWIVLGFDVPAVNASCLQSDLGGVLAEDEPFSIVWFEGSDRNIYISFRSAPGRENVGSIARLFGGGGHEHASGCRVSRDQLIPLDREGLGPKYTYTIVPKVTV